jgi:hypothetical protein
VHVITVEACKASSDTGGGVDDAISALQSMERSALAEPSVCQIFIWYLRAHDLIAEDVERAEEEKEGSGDACAISWLDRLVRERWERGECHVQHLEAVALLMRCSQTLNPKP